jgi:uncharacterized membrane protein YhaH (DUF805 family)
MDDSSYPLKTQHDMKSCLYWNLLLAVPIVTACTAIGTHSIVAVLFYLLFTILIFAAVLLRFFCTRCPHYIQSEDTVKCLFMWGAPKPFKDREGPYTFADLALVVIAVAVWALAPVYWLWQHFGLLLIYVLSLVAFGATVKRYECGCCTHFHCPMNDVPESIRSSHGQQS